MSNLSCFHIAIKSAMNCYIQRKYADFDEEGTYTRRAIKRSTRYATNLSISTITVIYFHTEWYRLKSESVNICVIKKEITMK